VLNLRALRRLLGVKRRRPRGCQIWPTPSVKRRAPYSLLTRYAKDNGLPNLQLFIDDGYSGTTFQRPGWQQLMAEVEAGRVSTIIMKEVIRF